MSSHTASYLEMRKSYRVLKRELSTPIAPEATEILKTLEDTMWNAIGVDVICGTATIPKSEGTFQIGGVDGSIPLPFETAEILYHGFNHSLIGVEDQGDVHDETLRMSHECPADVEHSTFSETLRTLNLDGLLEGVRQKLCPSAVSVEARPYKLVVYAKGDFFVTHRDSMNNPMQFGSLALQLPVILSEDKEVQSSEKTSPSNSGSSHPAGNGNLVFYVGRDVGSHCGIGDSYEKIMRNTVGWGGYGVCKENAEQLRYTVDLTTPLPQPSDSNLVAMKYAAWNGDVPHEVTRVDQNYRAVLIYRLYKHGVIERYIPYALRCDVVTLVRRLFVSLASTPKFENVGVILRHTYPPAGLVSQALKGVDHVLFSILNPIFECHLWNGVQCRVDYPSNPFRVHSRDKDRDFVSHSACIFATSDRVEAMHNLQGEGVADDLMQTYPVFTQCVWMQLGLGTVIGGGSIFGNADCGSDWYYRNAVMVVTQKPGAWERRKPLFLAALRGGLDTMKRLYEVEDVFWTICTFL